ncbi:Transcriptional regulator, Crp/Fnr family [uncultured Eubacteriales bacterium]|uniref:Transcriptional regulator, Crp/Fnr family n=1 Tax=uncultured Eubacteriales bacterium TaxID=172733 RepID=A0A212K6W3_9FIRM|nr:Transcriptional regulator, Crp/Fnr family [uncultured Eubacteriales bacterium]
MTGCACCSQDCLDKLCAHKIPVFASLSPEEMGRFSSIARHYRYEKGEPITLEGEDLNALVILSEGSAKAYKLTPDGREQILYVFSQGDFFGERNLLGGRKSAYTVEALEPVRTCAFGRDEFYALLRANPDIAIKVIEELEKRMERMENAVQSMGVRSLDSRIGGLLLDFAEKYGDLTSEGVLIRLPLSREGMANFLGVARETVSRKLSQLEADGILRTVGNKALLLLNGEELKSLAGKIE